MKRDDVLEHCGQLCYITGDGDLAFDAELRPVIDLLSPGTLVGLTKGGLARVEYEGKEYRVPPRNVRLDEDEIPENHPIFLPNTKIFLRKAPGTLHISSQVMDLLNLRDDPSPQT